jgi:sulfite exporter TauE/SafE
MARDRGPERRLVRDIVDSRRNIGSYFIIGALIVLVGSITKVSIVVLVSNILWFALALLMVIDSLLIARRVKRLVRERFPKTDQRVGSLQLYGVMRALQFRRFRTPNPQVTIGDKV